MAAGADDRGGRRGRIGRRAPWVLSAAILLLPLVAMRFTDEVAWDGADFIVMGALLFGACGAYEGAARTTSSRTCRAAVAVALAAAFLLIWINLAVGLIGSEDNPANLLFAGVLAVGVAGALIARFRPEGMARAALATALAQALTGAIALIAGWGSAEANGPAVIAALTAFFTALWLLSAWLFWRAGQERAMKAAG